MNDITMNQIEDTYDSPSYFWSCITLSKDCPFLSSNDPKLYYFGFGLLFIYGAFALMVLTDLNFYWSLDHFQAQIDYYINLIRKKVRHVQVDQRRLVSTQERTEKLLKKSEECKRMVAALRGALTGEDPQRLTTVTNYSEEPVLQDDTDMWDDHGVFDF